MKYFKYILIVSILSFIVGCLNAFLLSKRNRFNFYNIFNEWLDRLYDIWWNYFEGVKMRYLGIYLIKSNKEK
jgi:hypothetical protein